MSAPDLADLVARVEAADGPSRELFEEAAIALKGHSQAATDPWWERWDALIDAEAWLDAAMQLVPEGWVGQMYWDADDTEIKLLDDRVSPIRLPSQEARAATPALALCAAALSTHQQKEQTDAR